MVQALSGAGLKQRCQHCVVCLARTSWAYTILCAMLAWFACGLFLIIMFWYFHKMLARSVPHYFMCAAHGLWGLSGQLASSPMFVCKTLGMVLLFEWFFQLLVACAFTGNCSNSMPMTLVAPDVVEMVDQQRAPAKWSSECPT